MSNSGKLTALESIRGIAMLGVLGIHTGSYVLGTPSPNPHIIALLEVLSRFSVPIFFFVSAFGLFLPKGDNQTFSYWSHLRRRGQSVLIPYLTWSLLYMLHYTYVYQDFHIWESPTVYDMLFFGLSSYHLYFLLILLAFYLLMPLWRLCIPFLSRQWKWAMPLLLGAQIGFDYYSSYQLSIPYSENWLDRLIYFRINYLPFHYVFIFLLGGLCAARFSDFLPALRQYRSIIRLSYAFSIIALLMHYYYLLFYKNYIIIEAVDTVHQLSPLGIIYTMTSCLFLFSEFSHANRLFTALNHLLSSGGKHSYFIYLFHPFAMFYLWKFWEDHQLPLTDCFAPLFYLSVLLICFIIAYLIEKTGSHLPVVNFLLLGKTSRGKKL
ncbi:acyltransferase [Azotosporobacter soli]|uniref:acyltransferase n=1 Tax=Azotosporobacter soli TaxID=3055040 RepID=UPI0031FEF9D0